MKRFLMAATTLAALTAVAMVSVQAQGRGGRAGGAAQGAEPVGSSAEEFSRIMRDEVAKWAEVVKVSGAKAE